MRKSDGKKRTLGQRLREGVFPVLAGTALFLIYPSLVSYQDVASLTDDLKGQRWLASVTEAPGVSQLLAGSPANAAIEHASSKGPSATIGRQISLKENPVLGDRLLSKPRLEKEPQRVNRSLKGSRVVSATIMRPPDHFTAGSVVERHSMMDPLEVGDDVELAFIKLKPMDEALKVASAFHSTKKDSPRIPVRPDLPVMVASLIKESAPNLMAYSPEPQLRRSPFAAVLQDDQPLNIIPKLDKQDHRWAASPLPTSAFSDREQECLTSGIYFEARGEPVKGQAAVAQVILNRVRNPSYPDSICGVVYQNKNWRNRCQFSFACDRIADKVRDRKRWTIAKYVARETTEGRIWLKEVGSSTHYHATYVNPKWARAMKKVGRIGLHVFYRTFGGGWS